MKKFLFILFLLIAVNAEAAAPTRPNSYSSGGTIKSSEVNSDFNTIYNYLQGGVDTFADGSIASADLSGSLSLSDSQLSTITTAGKVNLSALSATSQATGDIVVSTSSSSMVRLGSAVAGFVLESQGVGSVPQWRQPTRYYVGTFSRDISAASGNVAYTGIGFTPKAVAFIQASGGSDQASVGFDSGSGQGAIFGNSGGTADLWDASGTQSIAVHISSGNNHEGNILTMDSDGFTIAWTKTGTPTGTANVYFIAYR